ncbi:MAG: CotH kinase family protein, partial [Planctomycetales bacterium]|nr:CotH kinase family protein [Planctomycetales bacterium]
EQVVDVDQWLRFFAMNVLVDNSENGLVNGDAEGDDYAMYRGVVDTRFKMVPHDLDSLFRDVNGTLFGTDGVPALNRFVNHPEILPRYYAQLRDLAENVVTSDQAKSTLADALHGVASNQEINSINNFLRDRAAYVLSQIPSDGLTVTSSLPKVGEFNRSTSSEVALRGTINDQAKSVTVNGQLATITGRERTWSIGEGNDGPATTLVARNSTWKYLDNGSNQGTAWRAADFNDTAWKSGAAELGYGDGDEQTVVNSGPSNNKYLTTYFRKEFTVADAESFVSMRLSLLRDDGAAVYLNGVEIVRDNLPANAGYNTQASNNVGGGEERTFFEFSVDPALLVNGRNVLAVEVHQDNGSSSDVSFNLEMEAFALGDVTGIQLNPGVNRLLVESFDGPAGTGARLDSTFIDVWYDDGDVQNVSGTLPGTPVVWTTADGPYRVNGKLVVPVNGRLTIEPGTSVYFDAGASIEVRGILQAEGTPFERIRFTSVPNAPLVPDNASNGLPNAPPHWNGVQFVSSRHSENLMSYVDVEYAQTSDGAIGAASNSELVIDNATFRGTHLRMVHVDSSSVIVQNSTFPDMFAPNEVAAGLGLDNVSEHIKAIGTIPSDGHLIFRNNIFGTNKGHNDVIDADSGRRPDPIVQILDNVFLGSGDEEIDLGGDAYIAGNFFMNIFKDDETSDRGYANGISTGDSGADTTIVVARNVFWNVDHAINLKRDAATIFENNTVVGIHEDFNDRFDNPNIGSAINFYVDEPGATAGTGAYAAGNIFWDSPRIFGNVDQIRTTTALQLNNNLMSQALATTPLGNRQGYVFSLGSGNFVGD